MSYKLKTKDIIRINIYLNKLTNDEINNNWENDKKRTSYYNFPSNPIPYIEDNCSEMRLYFIQDLRNIVFSFIQERFDMDIFSINQKSINVKRGLFFDEVHKFSIIDYYQILSNKTGDLSDKYIRTTILLEKEPTPWVANVIFELVKIVGNKVYCYKEKEFKPRTKSIAHSEDSS